MLNGSYAYRFSGHAMKENVLHYLVGVANMIMKDGVISSGEQSSTITPLSGSNAKAVNTRFSFTGNYADTGNRILQSTINFVEIAGPQMLTGQFHLIPAGAADRFWFISTKTINTSEQNAEADEVVSGEAILIPG